MKELLKSAEHLVLLMHFMLILQIWISLLKKQLLKILKNLDPHSTYISAKDVKEMNEPLNGNFEGIGIQFNLLRDSIIVVEPIAGGPSEKVGIRAGDRILTINNEKVTGIKITTSRGRKQADGTKRYKGRSNSFQKRRKEIFSILQLSVIRFRYTVLMHAYMLDKETGYIKLNKFAATTEKEFSDAIDRSEKKQYEESCSRS